MGDSFRADKAKARDAAAAIEARLSRLTGGGDESVAPRKNAGGMRLLTEDAKRDEDFRMACGAFVKGRTKPGVRAKYDRAEAERLRCAGADPDGADGDGWTGLHWAAAEGYRVIVEYLAAPGVANVDAIDKEGCTPLWTAAYNGEYQVALSLLAAGADVSPKGKCSGGAAMTASNAARSQRNPTIADAVDAEAELRRRDPRRGAALRSGEVDYDAFRASLRTVARNR